MQKVFLYIITLITSCNAIAQECPTLNNPANGSMNVPVTTTISWDEVVGVPGYIISIGTSPGATDIVNQRSVGSATSYSPPLGLPENTQIYVTLTLFFFNQPNISCPSETFRTEDVTTPPLCTTLKSPENGSININIGTSIVWNYAPTATNYSVSLGTGPGLNDILNNQPVGNTLSFDPPNDLPVDTEIFVSILPANENGSASACLEESFTTGNIATRPGCTALISPSNGAINVPLTPFLEWIEVLGATGYRVTIGNSPSTAEILDNVPFTTNSTFVIDFDPNKTFFITITPFNAAGDAIGCGQQSFSTLLGCGPFFDPITGELASLGPKIDFPDVVSFCQNESPFTTSSTDEADGYRWFRIDEFDNETLLSETSEIDLSENGQYRYEAYNTVVQPGGTFECATSKIFSAASSETASITSVDIIGEANGTIGITVEVMGIGDYEFALDNNNGPFQNSNSFTNIPPGSHTIYVNDKNGCGIVQELIEQDLTVEGFPKFFTPNGDLINDFWQFIVPTETGEINIESIWVFDRYGNLLTQIDPRGQGWNGDFNGKPLPATDYWFKAITFNKQLIRGHFALKR